jgi:short-subunit dehydrogenase involved in D-alanine esterification of teichoic acids
MPNTPVYSATKAAVHTYTLVLRQQLKGTQVKVIEIVPPMVDTDLNKAGRDANHLKFRGISLAMNISRPSSKGSKTTRILSSTAMPIPC